jgi:hypothetical protein
MIYRPLGVIIGGLIFTCAGMIAAKEDATSDSDTS